MITQKKYASNAQTKAIRNGPNGFAGFVLCLVSYIYLTGMIWTRYSDPGNIPLYPLDYPGSSYFATIKDTWKIHHLNYETMLQMNAALTSLILNAVPEIYLSGIVFGSLGASNHTTYNF